MEVGGGNRVAGWPIDLAALYGRDWKNRARFCLSEDLFDIPGFDACVFFYNVGEIGVGKTVGRVALFVDRASPRKVFERPGEVYWYFGDKSVQAPAPGLVLLYECRAEPRGDLANPRSLHAHLVAFDAARGRWGRLALERGFHRVQLLEGRNDRFTLTALGEPMASATLELHLDELVWKALPAPLPRR
jgi:hypothetical protein